MDISERLEEIKETISGFLRENTKITVAITAVLGVLAVSALVLGVIDSSKNEKKPDTIVLPDSIPYSVTQDFYPPKKDPLTEDYYFSRTQENTWSDSEFDRWFTVPGESAIDSLGRANDRIIDEITGAAP